MAEIQAQPTVADINGDGEVEIVVADVHGNVAAFNWRGKEVWERHLKSLVSQARLSSQHTLLNPISTESKNLVLARVHAVGLSPWCCALLTNPPVYMIPVIDH